MQSNLSTIETSSALDAFMTELMGSCYLSAMPQIAIESDNAKPHSIHQHGKRRQPITILSKTDNGRCYTKMPKNHSQNYPGLSQRSTGMYLMECDSPVVIQNVTHLDSFPFSPKHDSLDDCYKVVGQGKRRPPSHGSIVCRRPITSRKRSQANRWDCSCRDALPLHKIYPARFLETSQCRRS